MEDEPTEDWKAEVPRTAQVRSPPVCCRSFIHAANRTWFKRQTTVVRGAAARPEDARSGVQVNPTHIIYTYYNIFLSIINICDNLCVGMILSAS